MLLMKKEHRLAVNKAVFPGLQGGPHNHTTAAIAVALKEAATPEFKAYAVQVVANARRLAAELTARGFRLITGGTDNHLILVDSMSRGLPGRPFAQALNRAGLVCNSNTIPYDPRTPFDPSGVRLGTPAITSRGMQEQHMATIAAFFDRVANASTDEAELDRICNEVREFTRAFPAPGLEHLVQ
jgi:glycine hydroxymethyltransferase